MPVEQTTQPPAPNPTRTNTTSITDAIIGYTSCALLLSVGLILKTCEEGKHGYYHLRRIPHETTSNETLDLFPGYRRTDRNL